MPLQVGGRDEAVGGGGAVGARFRLDSAAAEVYGDLRLEPVLRRIIDHTGTVAGSGSGAISIVDGDAGRYTKAAERGVACQVGMSFPLDEGATGRAVALRRPVVLRDYADLGGGHLSAQTPAGHRSVLAVPAWWRGEVIGVNVVFRPPGVDFPTAVVDAVEALTQVLAPAIRMVRPLRERTLAATLRRSGGQRVVVTETGPSRPATAAMATTASEVVTALDRAVGGGSGPIRIGVVHRDHGVRLLVQREGRSASAAAVLDSLRAAMGSRAEALVVEDVPGWGLAVQVDLVDVVRVVGDPFTDREREVLELLRHGLTDRAIGAALDRSARTVEKHVGALMRKTGAANRTAAVMTALDQGWLAP
ncbi:MAG: GAF domain-containing protein [Acidobacteria bacterium]|nr:GAF domain-containing protein [Acidobacteriota bacterium]